MLRSGATVRFTSLEIEQYRKVGLDVHDVKHQNDIEQVVTRWVYTLADERPDLLDKLAEAMARPPGQNCHPGLRLSFPPIRLSNPDPFAGHLFKINEIISFNLAYLFQLTNHLQHQLRIFLRQLDDHCSNTRPVEVCHDATPPNRSLKPPTVSTSA